MDINRLPNETDIEWQIRLCLAKKRHEIDNDWSEIRDVLGLDITPDELRKRAVGMMIYDEYVNNSIQGLTCILSISDLHYPYVLDYSVLEPYKNRVDILQLNGDLVDFASLSKFPKRHRCSSVDELIGCRQYLIDLIKYLQPKKVVANYGNHDLRLGSFMSKTDNDIQEIISPTGLDYLFDDGFTHYNPDNGTKTKYAPLSEVFPDIDIVYTSNWFSRIGDCIFVHPKAFSSAPLKTAEKALLWFRNEGYDFRELVMGHTHRSGQYRQGQTNIFEQGAFCHTEKMDYADGLLVNSQKQGFIVLYQDKDGNTVDAKTRLVSLN